jgi:hypothetical protein
MAEYTSTALGGMLLGDLVYTELTAGEVSQAALGPDGRTAFVSSTPLAGGFDFPLDVIVGEDGTLYVAEFEGDQVTFLSPDSDNDGCSDGREMGTDASTGGGRDPDNAWDFYDVNGDFAVDLDDILAVAGAFGPAGEPEYVFAFDRSPSEPGGTALEMGPPDGAINLFDDVFGAARQFGHSCVEGA